MTFTTNVSDFSILINLNDLLQISKLKFVANFSVHLVMTKLSIFKQLSLLTFTANVLNFSMLINLNDLTCITRKGEAKD